MILLAERDLAILRRFEEEVDRKVAEAVRIAALAAPRPQSWRLRDGVGPGYRHIPIDRICVTCRRLGIKYAEAIAGWRKGGSNYPARPVINGVVVREAEAPKLVAEIQIRRAADEVPTTDRLGRKLLADARGDWWLAGVLLDFVNDTYGVDLRDADYLEGVGSCGRTSSVWSPKSTACGSSSVVGRTVKGSGRSTRRTRQTAR